MTIIKITVNAADCCKFCTVSFSFGHAMPYEGIAHGRGQSTSGM